MAMQRRLQPSGVFFTGVPLTVEKETLRQHFESVGHATEFRLFGPAPGKSFRYGIVDYLDERTAAEAITRLNGTLFGDRAMRVTAAQVNPRKRHRGDAYDAQDEADSGVATTTAGRVLLGFPRGCVDPLLGREDGAVLDRLRTVPVDDAYEAVEQLRVLALERRQEARLLLQENAALRSAVVLILQHAGCLPYGTLPPEAFQPDEAITTAGSSDTAGGDKSATTTAAGAARTSEQERDEVLELIKQMSEEDVARILEMKSSDLAAVRDVRRRRQLEVLRARLLEMASDLS